MNAISFQKKCEEKCGLIKTLSKGKDIYIWGTGHGAKILYSVMEKHNIIIKGFIDSYTNKKDHFLSQEVIGFNILKEKNIFPVISLMQYDRDIINILLEEGYSLKEDIVYIYEPDENDVLKQDIIYKGCKIGKYTYGYKELLEFFPIARSIGRYCSINGSAKYV